jgi:hypothetical protein
VPDNKADVVSVNAYKNTVIVNRNFAIFDLPSLSLLDVKVETPQHFASGCCDIDPPWAFVALV